MARQRLSPAVAAFLIGCCAIIPSGLLARYPRQLTTDPTISDYDATADGFTRGAVTTAAVDSNSASEVISNHIRGVSSNSVNTNKRHFLGRRSLLELQSSTADAKPLATEIAVLEVVGEIRALLFGNIDTSASYEYVDDAADGIHGRSSGMDYSDRDYYSSPMEHRWISAGDIDANSFLAANDDSFEHSTAVDSSYMEYEKGDMYEGADQVVSYDDELGAPGDLTSIWNLPLLDYEYARQYDPELLVEAERAVAKGDLGILQSAGDTGLMALSRMAGSYDAEVEQLDWYGDQYALFRDDDSQWLLPIDVVAGNSQNYDAASEVPAAAATTAAATASVISTVDKDGDTDAPAAVSAGAKDDDISVSGDYVGSWLRVIDPQDATSTATSTATTAAAATTTAVVAAAATATAVDQGSQPHDGSQSLAAKSQQGSIANQQEPLDDPSVLALDQDEGPYLYDQYEQRLPYGELSDSEREELFEENEDRVLADEKSLSDVEGQQEEEQHEQQLLGAQFDELMLDKERQESLSLWQALIEMFSDGKVVGPQEQAVYVQLYETDPSTFWAVHNEMVELRRQASMEDRPVNTVAATITGGDDGSDMMRHDKARNDGVVLGAETGSVLRRPNPEDVVRHAALEAAALTARARDLALFDALAQEYEDTGFSYNLYQVYNDLLPSMSRGVKHPVIGDDLIAAAQAAIAGDDEEEEEEEEADGNDNHPQYADRAVLDGTDYAFSMDRYPASLESSSVQSGHYSTGSTAANAPIPQGSGRRDDVSIGDAVHDVHAATATATAATAATAATTPTGATSVASSSGDQLLHSTSTSTLKMKDLVEAHLRAAEYTMDGSTAGGIVRQTTDVDPANVNAAEAYNGLSGNERLVGSRATATDTLYRADLLARAAALLQKVSASHYAAVAMADGDGDAAGEVEAVGEVEVHDDRDRGDGDNIAAYDVVLSADSVAAVAAVVSQFFGQWDMQPEGAVLEAVETYSAAAEAAAAGDANDAWSQLDTDDPAAEKHTTTTLMAVLILLTLWCVIGGLILCCAPAAVRFYCVHNRLTRSRGRRVRFLDEVDHQDSSQPPAEDNCYSAINSVGAGVAGSFMGLFNHCGSSGSSSSNITGTDSADISSSNTITKNRSSKTNVIRKLSKLAFRTIRRSTSRPDADASTQRDSSNRVQHDSEHDSDASGSNSPVRVPYNPPTEADANTAPRHAAGDLRAPLLPPHVSHDADVPSSTTSPRSWHSDATPEPAALAVHPAAEPTELAVIHVAPPGRTAWAVAHPQVAEMQFYPAGEPAALAMVHAIPPEPTAFAVAHPHPPAEMQFNPAGEPAAFPVFHPQHPFPEEMQHNPDAPPTAMAVIHTVWVPLLPHHQLPLPPSPRAGAPLDEMDAGAGAGGAPLG